MAFAKSTDSVSLKPLTQETVKIDIEGTAPLIVHAWSKKAREMMLMIQQGKKPPKEPKNPERDFQESMYRFDDGGHGIPMLGVKAATVAAATHFKGVTKVALRGGLLFHPDGFAMDGTPLVRLNPAITSDPVMREDLVRVGMGSADLRYRAMYERWGATLEIEYLPNLLDLGSVIALIDAGGMTCGLCEWRPERDGIFGTYRVVT